MKKPLVRPKTRSSAQAPLLLIGGGKMGSAMLKGWLAHGLNPKKLIVVEPQPTKELKALGRRGLGLALNAKDLPGKVAAVVVAVKPQTASAAMLPLRAVVGPHTLVLSIMAGRTLKFLQSMLPPHTAIVRAMPNTPAAVGRSITVAVANNNVSERQRKQASKLLSAIGQVEWIENEKLMDAVTAVSGSGPAYIFLLAESMAKAGVAAGLPFELATRLARETIAGAGELLAQSTRDAATLRQDVTSPGGTTAAALEVLMGPNGFDRLLTKAIAGATIRSRQLAG
jgi:pyrroline-5-carboxylate reductase